MEPAAAEPEPVAPEPVTPPPVVPGCVEPASPEAVTAYVQPEPEPRVVPGRIEAASVAPVPVATGYVPPAYVPTEPAPPEEVRRLEVRCASPMDHKLTEQHYGTPPETGPCDFDLCFVFPLPQVGQLEAAAEAVARKGSNFARALQHQSAEETITRNSQDEHFRENLRQRTRRILKEGRKDVTSEELTDVFVSEGSTESESPFRPLRSFAREDTTNLFGKAEAQTRERVQEEIDQDDKVRHENAGARLVRDYILDEQLKVAAQFDDIDSFSHAISACISLLLEFFRRDEEKYYSYMFTSVGSDRLILCVKMLEDTARKHAADSDYQLQLNKSAVKKKLGIHLGNVGSAAMEPAYVKFKSGLTDLVKSYPCEADPSCKSRFLQIDNTRLLYDRVTDVFDLEGMRKWGMLLEVYPLHNKEPLKELASSWATIARWYEFDQPIDKIRDYFGENVALYFVFCEHLCRYTRYVVVAGFFSMAVDIGEVMAGYGSFGNKLEVMAFLGGNTGLAWNRLGFALFMIVWCNIFVVHLRRKIRHYYNLWGADSNITDTVKSQVNSRFAETARVMPSEVDENLAELDVSTSDRVFGRAKSLIGSMVFILCTFASVALFFALQAYLISTGQTTLATYVSFGLTIQIKVVNAVWRGVVKYLTDFEHLKTSLEFDNSVAMKTFYVQVISMFSSFYYIAFVMENLGDTTFKTYGDTPWGYLTYQMLLTFGLYLAFTAYDLITPLYSLWKSHRDDTAKLKEQGLLPEGSDRLEYSYIELQMKMSEYGGPAQNDDYMDVVSVFGFVLLFGITIPIGSAFALIYLALQMRVDAWKLVMAMRRPYPRRAHVGPWVWQNVAEQFAYLGAITNIGLICFLLQPFRGWDAVHKGFLFFVLFSFAYVMFVATTWLWPDESSDIELACRRHSRQRLKAEEYVAQHVHQVEALKLRARVELDLSRVSRLLKEDGSAVFQDPPAMWR